MKVHLVACFCYTQTDLSHVVDLVSQSEKAG